MRRNYIESDARLVVLFELASQTDLRFPVYTVGDAGRGLLVPGCPLTRRYEFQETYGA